MGFEFVSFIGYYYFKVVCLLILLFWYGYYFLVWDIVGWFSWSSWLSLFGFCWCIQIFLFVIFIGFVVIDVIQYQIDDEE